MPEDEPTGNQRPRWGRAARALASQDGSPSNNAFSSPSILAQGQEEEACVLITPMSLRCMICLELVSNDRGGQAGLTCGHPACADCAVDYLESMVQAGRVSEEELCCPLPDCRRPLKESELVRLLSGSRRHEELYEQLLDFQAKRFVPEAGERFVTCPTPSCAKLLIPEEVVSACEEVTCPTCSQPFCAGCCHAPHAGLSCEEAEMQRLDPELRKLLERERWVRCPSCRHLCERESGCNFMTCPSEECRSQTHFCYLCGELLAASDHAAHYEGFEGAVGRMGPFGSVCVNKRSLDTSLPQQPPPPRLNVVAVDDEASIALRVTFGAHKSEPPTIYYRVHLQVVGSNEFRTLVAGVHEPHFDVKAGRRIQKYRTYQATVTPVNVNGAGKPSEPSEPVYLHHREMSVARGSVQLPPKERRWQQR